MDIVAYFEENLGHIEDAVRAVSSRHSVYGEEAEDFCSLIKLKIIEDDYRILREFKGRSSIKTYLYAVINRIFIDELRKKIGRWRPSEEAKRLGSLAVRLEELLGRDSYSFDEAYEIMSNSDVSIDRNALYALATMLPARASRPSVQDAEELLADVPSPAVLPDSELHRKRMSEVKLKMDKVVERINAMLSAEDRLLLKMRFDNNLKISEIARSLGESRGTIDKRISRILVVFKEGILAAGVNINDACDVIRLISESGEINVD